MKEQILLIDGRKCHVFGRKHFDSYMICGMEEHIPNEASDTLAWVANSMMPLADPTGRLIKGMHWLLQNGK